MGNKNRAFDHRHYTDWRRPEDLIPYGLNAKIHDEHQIRNLVTSLKRFGWQQDCVITSDNVLVIGHGRQMAAMRIGCEIPVHVIDKKAEDLTDEDIRELRIADNQTNAETGFDFDLLAQDMDGLDFDGFDFNLNAEYSNSDWFQREEKDGKAREDGNDEYNEFLEKFEAKKTTDDCYTPENIYQAVAKWVAKRYALDASTFVRPFFPGGDYKSHNYPKKCAVVDNPPFSILAEIIDFYLEKRIPFFLFGPSLAVFNYINRPGVTAVAQYNSITYENGATVKTSFLTNMEGDNVAAFTDTELFEAVDAANEENEKALHVSLPKYEYPDEVLTSAKMGWLVQYGQTMTIRRDESVLIRALDAQKEQDKTIYGGGLLLSERAAAERAAAERAAAERAAAERAAAERAAAERAAATKWKLSEREKEIVRKLGKDVLIDG